MTEPNSLNNTSRFDQWLSRRVSNPPAGQHSPSIAGTNHRLKQTITEMSSRDPIGNDETDRLAELISIGLTDRPDTNQKIIQNTVHQWFNLTQLSELSKTLANKIMHHVLKPTWIKYDDNDYQSNGDEFSFQRRLHSFVPEVDLEALTSSLVDD